MLTNFSEIIAAMHFSVTEVPRRSKAKRSKVDNGNSSAKIIPPISLISWQAKQPRSKSRKDDKCRSCLEIASKLLSLTPWQPIRLKTKVSKVFGKALEIATTPSSPMGEQPSKSNLKNFNFDVSKKALNFWSPALVIRGHRPKLSLKCDSWLGKAIAISVRATSVISLQACNDNTRKCKALGRNSHTFFTPTSVTWSHLVRWNRSSWSLGGKVGASLSRRSSVSCFISVRFKFLTCKCKAFGRKRLQNLQNCNCTMKVDVHFNYFNYYD